MPTKKLESMLDDVQSELMHSTGGHPVSRVKRHGQVTQVMRQCEGKEFIIRKAVDMLKNGASAVDIRSFLDEQTSRFQSYRTSRVTASPEWCAYIEGGLSGISEVESVLSIDKAG